MFSIGFLSGGGGEGHGGTRERVTYHQNNDVVATHKCCTEKTDTNPHLCTRIYQTLLLTLVNTKYVGSITKTIHSFQLPL